MRSCHYHLAAGSKIRDCSYCSHWLAKQCRVASRYLLICNVNLLLIIFPRMCIWFSTAPQEFYCDTVLWKHTSGKSPGHHTFLCLELGYKDPIGSEVCQWLQTGPTCLRMCCIQGPIVMTCNIVEVNLHGPCVYTHQCMMWFAKYVNHTCCTCFLVPRCTESYGTAETMGSVDNVELG